MTLFVCGNRYTDFVWLVERLEEFYAGVIIPPLPPKKSLGRFESSFIESRRVALERFLNRLAKHAKLSKSQDLAMFVRAPDAAFILSKGETVKKSLTSMVQWIGTTISQHTVHHVPARSPASRHDLQFEEMKLNVDELLIHALETSKNVNLFIDQSLASAVHMKEYTDTLLLLESIEKDDAVLNMYLKDTSHCAGKLAEAHDAFSLECMNAVQFPLEDYVGLLHSIQRAFKRREALRKKYDFCKEQIEILNSKILCTKDAKTEELRHAELQLALDEDKLVTARLNAVSDELIAEFQYFKESRLLDLAGVMSGLAKAQERLARNCGIFSKTLVTRVETVTPEGYAFQPPGPPVVEERRSQVVIPRPPSKLEAVSNNVKKSLSASAIMDGEEEEDDEKKVVSAEKSDPSAADKEDENQSSYIKEEER